MTIFTETTMINARFDLQKGSAGIWHLIVKGTTQGAAGEIIREHAGIDSTSLLTAEQRTQLLAILESAWSALWTHLELQGTPPPP